MNHLTAPAPDVNPSQADLDWHAELTRGCPVTIEDEDAILEAAAARDRLYADREPWIEEPSPEEWDRLYELTRDYPPSGGID